MEREMSTTLEVTEFRPDADLASLSEILGAAFNSSVEDVHKWIDSVGHENVRVLRRDGRPIGSLNLVPMGQWFGGRSVAMTGVSGVAVAPHERAGGAGSILMKAALEEMRADGKFLSTLYAATEPVYRRVGYECAGGLYEIRLQTYDIDVRDRELEMAPITPDDNADVEECHRRWSMRHNGNVDRGPFLWLRARRPRKGVARGYLVRGPSGVEGYLYFVQNEVPDGRYEIAVNSTAALTPAAARRILTFVADHRSMAYHVQWDGGPTHPYLTLLAEPRCRVKLWEYWFLRIVDVAGALQARGYAPSLRGEVHFDIRDDVLPDNSGKFVLSVEGGRGRVEPGGDGRVRIDIRGLAPLYTGHWGPAHLRMAGYLDAADDDASAAAALFAGPAPWMADRF